MATETHEISPETQTISPETHEISPDTRGVLPEIKKTKIKMMIKPKIKISIKHEPDEYDPHTSRRYPQLTLNEEAFILKRKDGELKKEVDDMLKTPPILLDQQGVMFLNDLLMVVQSSGVEGITNTDRANHLLFPISYKDDVFTTQRDFFRTCIKRDFEGLFSDDFSCIIFTHEKNTLGVIYPDKCLFYTRFKVRGHDNMERVALYKSVEYMFLKIHMDPINYLTMIGRTCGLCVNCGRELSDPESKRLGMGPVCHRYMLRWYDLRRTMTYH